MCFRYILCRLALLFLFFLFLFVFIFVYLPHNYNDGGIFDLYVRKFHVPKEMRTFHLIATSAIVGLALLISLGVIVGSSYYAYLDAKKEEALAALRHEENMLLHAQPLLQSEPTPVRRVSRPACGEPDTIELQQVEPF